MKIWGASHGNDGPGIFLDEMPLWYYLLLKFSDGFCTWFFLHDIDLPNWPRWCGDKEDGYCTPKEYYGDLGCLWDCWALNGFVNKLYPKYVKGVWIPLSEEEVARHPNHDDKIFWMQEQRSWIEYEAKREAAGDNDQPGLSGADAGGTGASS
jgi:hypothetical protein